MFTNFSNYPFCLCSYYLALSLKAEVKKSNRFNINSGTFEIRLNLLLRTLDLPGYTQTSHVRLANPACRLLNPQKIVDAFSLFSFGSQALLSGLNYCQKLKNVEIYWLLLCMIPMYQN